MDRIRCTWISSERWKVFSTTSSAPTIRTIETQKNRRASAKSESPAIVHFRVYSRYTAGFSKSPPPSSFK